MRKIVLFVALMVALLPLCAQEQPPRPTLLKITFPQSAAINALSDNGSWAAASGVGEDQSEPAYPYLVNAVDGSLTELWDDDNPVQGGISANDVTDDGQIVVGSYGGRPAFCNTATKTWTTLACDDGGVAEKVTPDGRYIAGWGASSSFSADNYSEVPLLWERQADGSYRRVDVVNEWEGFPTQDKTGANTNMLRIENMSADGNVLAGAINFIYPAVACYYVYNRTTHETYYIDNAMTGVAEGSFVDQSVMSNNGAYMSGIMQLVIADGDEYAASYLYATADNGLTMYNVDAEEQDRGGYAVTNSGLVLASSPAVNPLRSVYVRYNSLWFGLDELLYSRYGINYYEQTGYEYTGIVCGVSDDEKVIAGMALTQTDGYIIRLQEPLATAAAGVNPLEAYAVSPAAGSQFARFRSVTLAFSKKVTLAAGVGAQLLDEEGNLLRPYTITPGSDGRTFTIGGRPQSLEQDKRYTLRIPAGAFTLTQDNAFSSEEINITYVGRDEQPVAKDQVAFADLATAALDGETVAQRISALSNLAQVDPYRAATHNKGIMNGIDAAVLASGNDWRAIESGAHAYAAKDGNYRGLAVWTVGAEGLMGMLELPLPVGTVGGSIKLTPQSKLNYQISRIQSAKELAQVITSLGLAQNLAALRALATTGIQAGHMKLQYRSLALSAGATPAEVPTLVAHLATGNHVDAAKATALLREMRENE